MSAGNPERNIASARTNGDALKTFEMASKVRLDQIGKGRLRLNGDDVCTKGQECLGSVADMGPDVEHEVFGSNPAFIEALEGSSAPWLAIIDHQ